MYTVPCRWLDRSGRRRDTIPESRGLQFAVDAFVHSERAEVALGVQLGDGYLVSIYARQKEASRLLDPLTVDGAPDRTINHSLKHAGCGYSVFCICQLVSCIRDKAALFTALLLKIAPGESTCGGYTDFQSMF